MCAELINRNYKDYSLLDIGCRTMELKPLLQGCRHYRGADMMPGEDIFQCDLEENLQFEDNSFDIVTALDVLEHLENAHTTLVEMFRVAQKAVFVSLPNMYYIEFRLNFLRGLGVSGKYAFPTHPITDRHRWLLSHSEALHWIQESAARYSVEDHMLLPVRGRARLISEPIEKWLGATWPNLFAYGVLFKIKMDERA